MEAGHQELGACDWPRPPGRGSWSYAQTYKAQRLIDGGMGERLGYKSFEEPRLAAARRPSRGEGWVYYLYQERFEEVEGLI